MNRVICFAHYDKNNTIEDYVIYYLEELKKISNKIIFVSDSNISCEELKKIEKIVDKSIVGKHAEYDFGSYKRGFLYAREQGFLDNCDELIFANDSCYAPLYPFEGMFSTMEQRNIDFWGPTSNAHAYEKINNKFEGTIFEHVQSYFIVFRKNVFLSDIFYHYIDSIHHIDDKTEIIYEYEIKLSKLLLEHGYKFDTFSKICKNSDIKDSIIYKYDYLIKNEKIPFLKRSLILLKKADIIIPYGIKKTIQKYTKYNYAIIQKDRKNNIDFSISKILRGIKRQCIRLHISQDNIRIVLFGKTLYEKNIK